jgi:dihydrofolate reductase
MRKLIVKMSMSLDGFVCGPNGENDWVFRSGDPESKAWSLEQISDAGLIAIGRKSFEMMAPYWITSTDLFAPTMNEIPKAVFTKQGYKGFTSGEGQPAAASSWAQAQVFNGDLAEEVSKLKAGEGKPIVAIGGARFVQSLVATGLVDEYRLPVHPVALGSGVAIFGALPKPLDLKLIDVKIFKGGVAGHVYRV